MKSSEGKYWIALDHVRALAAVLVFSWHFTHGASGRPVAFEGAPALFPLALFDEGHTGVSVFMTLSGYLFAKILAGRDVSYPAFFYNRLLRLAPLLILTKAIEAALFASSGGDMHVYWSNIVRGFIWPTWSGGGWSITVELHFYLLLPFIMAAQRRDPRWLMAMLAGAIAIRTAMFFDGKNVPYWAYWTIFGRIDQFLLGILAFSYRERLRGHGFAVGLLFLLFCGIYWVFDALGGFYHLPDHGRAATALWIVLPTVEGLAYAAMIVTYDTRTARPPGRLSRFIGRLGAVSYSLYLFHFFLYQAMVDRLVGAGIASHSLYVWLPLSAAGFVCLYPLSWASFRFFEEPFLRLRVRYTRAADAPRQLG